MAHKYVTSRASTLALAPNWARSINAKIIVSSCQIERAGAGNNKYYWEKKKKLVKGKKNKHRAVTTRVMGGSDSAGIKKTWSKRCTVAGNRTCRINCPLKSLSKS